MPVRYRSHAQTPRKGGSATPAPEVIERLTTAASGELVLRRRGADYEIIANGTFLMATHGGRSERAMVDLALADAPAGRRLLVGGLGVGYTLAACLAHPATVAVTVVEREPAIVRWNRTHLRQHNGGAPDDPRTQMETADLSVYLAGPPQPFDAILLDTDNGPGWLVSPENARLYGPDMLQRLRHWLAPGGVLAVWSAQPEPDFAARLRQVFGNAGEHAIAADRGYDYVYLGRLTSRAAPGPPGRPGR